MTSRNPTFNSAKKIKMADTKKSVSYEKAENMLPAELHGELARFVEHYKFSAQKHTGRAMVHPVVLAELLLMGWRETEK